MYGENKYMYFKIVKVAIFETWLCTKLYVKYSGEYQ